MRSKQTLERSVSKEKIRSALVRVTVEAPYQGEGDDGMYRVTSMKYASDERVVGCIDMIESMRGELCDSSIEWIEKDLASIGVEEYLWGGGVSPSRAQKFYVTGRAVVGEDEYGDCTKYFEIEYVEEKIGGQMIRLSRKNSSK